jgi:small subunit ribosomal protein S20
VRNRAWKTYVRSARNRVEEAAKGGTDVNKAMSEAFSKIDRAVTKGVLHKNTAARRKARLAKMVIRLSAAPTKATKGRTKKAAS